MGKKSILVHNNIQIILFMRIVLEKRDISHEQKRLKTNRVS